MTRRKNGAPAFWSHWDQVRARQKGWVLELVEGVLAFVNAQDHEVDVTPLTEDEVHKLIAREASRGSRFHARALKVVMVANLTGDYRNVHTSFPRRRSR